METSTIQVLHLDDDPDLIDLAATIIERDHTDITVQPETDPRECLNRLEANPAHFDCIVSDYDMPYLNGLEVLQSVRDQFPDFPFILFTGKGSEEIAAEAIANGIDDYMQKQGGIDQYEVLANRIEQHVHRVRTEQALRNSEEKFRALVEQNIVGIYLIEDYTFQYVNPRLADIFGYTQDELLDQPASLIVANADQERVTENLRKRLDGEVDTIRYELTGKHKNGESLDILVQGQRITLNDHPAIAGVLIDREQLTVT